MPNESVNPQVLRWARETAGLDIEAAAHKLALSSSKGMSASQKLEAIESGERAIPRSLLLKMSQQYHRPLLAFYMEEPPRKGERGTDFRTLPQDKKHEDEHSVDALVRAIRGRQALVRELIEDDEDFAPLSFVGKLSLDTPVREAAVTVCENIGFDRALFRRSASDQAFKYLRSLVERAGVFVLLVGNLGSHRSNISAEVFRGLAVADRYAPFIVINDQDARIAWSFTLLHELVHIWLGLTGISGGPIEARVERYCNDVASHILLSPDEILVGQVVTVEDALLIAGELGARANISRSLVIYRLFRQGALSEPDWRAASDQLQMEWQSYKRQQKEEDAAKRRDKKGGGPSYYVVHRFHVGQALIDLVRRSINEGALSPTRAGRVLGVKATSVFPLIGGEAA